ncbi:MAG: LacI family DNA-binding transcriptional regulator [Candidatus Limnocylindrales bacterium]
MANLKDVARRADVDPSTASRVLRDDPSQQVRPETRERILEAARELRYRPNALARGLRTRRTDTFGLIIPSLDNLGFADVTHGIQSAAAGAGKLVMVVEAEAVADAAAHGVYQRLIGDGRLDGLIVAFASIDDDLVGQLVERGIPLVLVNRRTNRARGSVVVDDERGSRLAVEHLLALGHRRVGYLGIDADTDTARRRMAGYSAAMAAAGIDVDARWLAAGPPTEEGGRHAVREVLAGSSDRRPTGYFVASLMSAIGALSELAEGGVVVPRDASLVAFNDHPFAAHTAPPLTTIRMPNVRMGEQAVGMLLAAMEGEPVRDVVIEEAPELVIRASTAAPPAA